MNADERVKVWALDKYLDKYKGYENTEYYHKFNHLKTCPTAEAYPVRAEWLCGCYSEYTRDDDFNTLFDIKCACGVEDTFSYMSSDYSLPDILRELDEYDTTQECPYWED